MSEPLKWYDHNADNPPWVKALAEVRRRATREGWCYQHVQGDHRLDRPVCRSGTGQPRLLSEQALWHWRQQERSRPLVISRGFRPHRPYGERRADLIEIVRR